MSQLSQYFRDTVAELKQVKWPTQKQAFIYSVLVVLISAIVALFLSAFDQLFSLGIDYLVTRFY